MLVITTYTVSPLCSFPRLRGSVITMKLDTTKKKLDFSTELPPNPTKLETLCIRREIKKIVKNNLDPEILKDLKEMP